MTTTKLPSGSAKCAPLLAKLTASASEMRDTPKVSRLLSVKPLALNKVASATVVTVPAKSTAVPGAKLNALLVLRMYLASAEVKDATV